MKHYSVPTRLAQKYEDNIYIMNVETIASQVKMFEEDGSTSSTAQKEIETLRNLVHALEQTNTATAKIFIKNTISDRNAIEDKNVGDLVWVLDASADDTVNSGAAQYIWTGTEWHKVSEAESLDVVLQWADVQNKPSSSVDDIDSAVDQMHTHTNGLDFLDKLGEDSGNLTYDGEIVGGSYHVEMTGFNSNLDTLIGNLGNIADGSIIAIYTEAPTPSTSRITKPAPAPSKQEASRITLRSGRR